MTNNWTDMANSSAFVIMGANPVENHPASFAHINAARAKGAKLLVIDPRKTRTACQVNPDNGDRYIRIRPGTDIAFLNGVLRRIIEKMEDTSDTSVTATQRSAFFAYLNETSGGTQAFTDGDASGAASLSKTGIPGSSKYTDARFLVKADGTDYQRAKIDASGTLASVSGVTDNSLLISNWPQKAADVQSDPNTVYNRLKAHVEPYTPDVVASICDCAATELDFVAKFYIDNSRCSTVNTAVGSSQNPTLAGYKSLTMLYAMGQTQHTYGAQNVKSFAVIQTLMGNMGRAGGGINALRGIHNVQGSTDMGNLYHLIPFYSGNPSKMSYVDASGNWDPAGTRTNGFGMYMDTLWTNGVAAGPLSGTGNRTNMNASYDDAYVTGNMGWQARGFYNMTYNFFGDQAWAAGDRTLTDALYDLWPKTNGDDHITMFRKAKAGTIGAMVIWGQNPAVTEPNQSSVRDGLKNLDMLAVVDLFETETAACERKAGSVTYLIPAASHVEEAGSVTNSGRTLQWRERVTLPKGNSRSDLELMFRLAKAFDDKGCFSHITSVWTAQGKAWTSAYNTLYGARYGYTPGTTVFNDASGIAEVWHGTDITAASETVTGCEWFAEQMYREMCKGVTNGGTSWLYQNAYVLDYTSQKHTSQTTNWKCYNRAKNRDNTNWGNQNQYPGWGYSWLVNRRVLYNNGENAGDTADFFMGPDSCSRLFVSTNSATLNYARWYRTIHRMSDKPDVTITGKAYTNLATPHFIARTDGSGNVSLSGRFPGHTEPYETPRAALATTWGRNTRGNEQWELAKFNGTYAPIAGRDVSTTGFPFVLTTIRCVEHFQGGPITRNNPWNVEIEPEPWIEINSIDAADKGIKTGDLVQVTTARSNSTTDQNGRTVELPTSGSTASASTFAQGFRARVGVGLAGNQRVGVGVVAIPWHWGDKGLSTGSRANDLCLDAGDANTTIPEYKACLCQITKIS